VSTADGIHPGAAGPSTRVDAGPAPVLRLRGVSVVRGGVPLLDGVDWEVAPGGRWVLLGPNGSGKTTLLQVAGARLLPSGGRAEVLGARLGRVDMRALRARVAMVSGALVRQLRPSLTAREVVVTGRDGSLDPHWRVVPADDWAAADRMLARLGLSGEDGHAGGGGGAGRGGRLGERQFGVLSEGERQQVLIARALMGPAELVLLDEPAAGLDLGARERLVTRLGELAADPAVPALVLVTHHVEEIPPGFTHAALLRQGRMVAAGPLESVMVDEPVSACFGARVHVGRRNGRWWAQART
jgi:iron complex transport system ATP-binding protein